MKKIRIAMAQMNPVVGDLRGNRRKISRFIEKARKQQADIVAFPELATTGYPPEDLVMKPYFIKENREVLTSLISRTGGITVILGFIDSDEGLYNAAAVISDGKLVDVYRKIHLPNYGVFDECRYFLPGNRYPLYRISGVGVGVNICEDIWHSRSPSKIQALLGADVIININASPYHMGKAEFRRGLVNSRSRESGVPIIYVNMVGGQDELVFDGGSFAVNAEGDVLAEGHQFREELLTLDVSVPAQGGRKGAIPRSLLQKGETTEILLLPAGLRKGKDPLPARRKKTLSPEEEVYRALVLGTKDYVRKNGFSGVVIGMSGGVDSALVTTLAVDALGRENVHGLFMPSQYTSRESREDAFAHAENLGIVIREISIDSIFATYLETLSGHFKGLHSDITEENLQARIRGNLLMAFSNKFGWLVLTTGNKSEMSVGYATLYGDMAGGFAVIKDVPKMLVYGLCTWRNHRAGKDLIPERILWKEPTAELRPDQRDIDSLPPYPILDPILKAYVEEDRSFEEIRTMGCDVPCTQRVIDMVDHAEYKRRQAPPGIKITPRAFGKDRRFPITNRYKSY